MTIAMTIIEPIMHVNPENPARCTLKETPKISVQTGSYPKLKGFKIGHLNITNLPIGPALER